MCANIIIVLLFSHYQLFLAKQYVTHRVTVAAVNKVLYLCRVNIVALDCAVFKTFGSFITTVVEFWIDFMFLLFDVIIKIVCCYTAECNENFTELFEKV